MLRSITLTLAALAVSGGVAFADKSDAIVTAAGAPANLNAFSASSTPPLPPVRGAAVRKPRVEKKQVVRAPAPQRTAPIVAAQVVRPQVVAYRTIQFPTIGTGF